MANLIKEVRVKASDLLTREDIQKLLDACSTKRGRAFISMLYESGARIGEILNVKLVDLVFDEHGVLVSLDGKTGRRRIRLVESAEFLRDWVNEIKLTHPKTAYLWFGIDDSSPSQYATTCKFLRKLVKKAKLRKKVYPHLFRHSRASELAQKLKESQLRAFMGWTGSSDMPRIYIHLSAQDLDNAILDLYKTEETKDKTELDEMTKFFAMWKQMKALN
jgi:integrase